MIYFWLIYLSIKYFKQKNIYIKCVDRVIFQAINIIKTSQANVINFVENTQM